MLENDFRKKLDDLWESSVCNIAIPRDLRDDMLDPGVRRLRDNDHRRFARHHFSQKAVLELNQTLPAIERSHQFFGVLTKDLSRTGICFLHAEQLYPCEEIILWLSTEKKRCSVVRCVRHGSKCYEIGLEFCRESTGREPLADSLNRAETPLDRIPPPDAAK